MEQVASTVGARQARPFLKWVGGKARLWPTLAEHLPKDAAQLRHVEPFVGGGALFFHRQPQRALLADLNRHLIETYRALKTNLNGVIGGLEVLEDGGYELARYEEVRELYNHATLPLETRAAMLIYLNKTCFNGIYRVNKRGHFNVPPGVFKSEPNILDRPNLIAVHRALQGVELRVASFELTMGDCGAGDFIYLDPPYMPLTKTANFTSYTEDGFNDDMQYALAREFVKADKRGARIMLSMSDHERAHEIYKHYRIFSVRNSRSVSVDPANRGSVSELLIRNY
jgi:DNA adenine methylase